MPDPAGEAGEPQPAHQRVSLEKRDGIPAQARGDVTIERFQVPNERKPLLKCRVLHLRADVKRRLT